MTNKIVLTKNEEKMKKGYSIPRTRVVECSNQPLMSASAGWARSLYTGGDYDNPPVMGTDGEGEYGICLNDLN